MVQHDVRDDYQRPLRTKLYIQPKAWRCVDTSACLSWQPIASSNMHGRRIFCKRDATYGCKEKKLYSRHLHC